MTYSTNERAEKLMGRRLREAQESGDEPAPIAIDYPVELGYQCPIHKRTMADAERVTLHVREGQIVTDPDVPGLLEWSEYNCFLWCPECDRDWPSALCVPIDNPADSAFDCNAGPDDAIKVYLDTVEQAVARAVKAVE